MDFDSIWNKFNEVDEISAVDERADVKAGGASSKISTMKTELFDAELEQQFSALPCNDDSMRLMQALKKIVAADALRYKFSAANLEAVNCLAKLLDIFMMKLCRCIGLLYDRNLQRNIGFDNENHMLFDVVERAFKIVGVGDFQTLMREFGRQKFENDCESVTRANCTKMEQEFVGQTADHDRKYVGLIE